VDTELLGMDAFTAIADPTRRRILEILAGGPRGAGMIAARFAVSAPAISQHLKTLRDAQLVRMRVDSQRRIYSLDQRGFKQLDCWLQRYRSFWNENLDALEAALQANMASSALRRSPGTPRSRKRGKAERP
jgi:DNA-binding transcriptional ArsR family regulator